MALSDRTETQFLDSLFTTTVYLRLLQSTTAGLRVNGDATLPAGLTEVASGNGYAPLAIPSSYWASAIGGSPTIKTVPTAPHSPITFTPTGTTWNLASFAFTSDSNAISATNFIASDCFVDTTNTLIVHHIGDGEPFQITNIYPLVVRLGDPPNGVNPT